ncbi:hypothetical protein BWQ96_03707 [Gracilariopsis chorda]|uniref:Elongator complex protein 6 n=1 Tax=Gracilariopsis chorda TaxID=448386 RepID=A0A2V3IWG2_9FLOR|nr:hypothetical protein BWQ96_03707 [Gracilariopsis chorda]|eukprot:PXF46472.1 hypothetical protein BWQ96_03707 [Gracilariopsis chorda]
MSTKTLQLLHWPSILSAKNVTLIRDATDAADALPLLHHLVRVLSLSKHLSPPEILFLTTNSRAQIPPTSKTCLFPFLTRSTQIAFAHSTPCDPYTFFEHPHEKQSSAQSTKQFLRFVSAAAKTSSAKVIVVECVHALQTVFAVDILPFIKTLTTMQKGLSVMLSAPVHCGIDRQIATLADMADTIIDLNNLQTGYAPDVDGTLKLVKQQGKWQLNSSTNRYKITEPSFKIYI